MRNILFLCGCLFVSCGAFAEQMNFVTTLSSPMGTFAHLETADHAVATTAPIVNFCNTRCTTGSMTVSGANAYLQTLFLKNGSTLGGSTPEFRVSGVLSSQAQGKITGARLMASALTVQDSTDPKSKVEGNLYAASAKVQGARTDSLVIPNQVRTGAPADGTTGTDLHWSNIYAKDYKCSGGACSESGGGYTSYLLKSMGSACKSSAADCLKEGKIFKEEPCVCESCPSGKVTLDGLTCRYQFVAEIKDVKVLGIYYSGMGSTSCGTIHNKMYYTGGSLPAASKGNTRDDCAVHIGYSATYYAHINGGGNYQQYANYYYWEASHTSGYFQGKDIPKCANSNYDSLCNTNCNANSSSCSYKCISSGGDVPASAGLFWCKISGTKRYGCNNNAGSGKMMTCKVKS